jgi:hypothetical protein
MPIIFEPQHYRAGGKTQAFGDLFGGIMRGITAGTLEKRRRQQEDKQQAAQDAMKIWQMAQIDPLVLQAPQAEQAFKLAGWPKPTISPTEPVAEENWDDALKQLRAAKLRFELEQMGAIPGEQQGPPATPTPAEPDKPGWWSRLWGGRATPETTPTMNPNALVAPPWDELVPQGEKWLDPQRATGFAPTAPTSRQQALQTTMDTLRDRGIGVPMPRAAKARKRVPAREVKEPATQQEFEQTVREMAKTDRQKAKAYYDKWVSKWQ